MIRLITVTTSALLLTACGGAKHAATYDLAAASATGDISSTMELADAAWDNRGDTASLINALELYEETLSTDPGNRHALERLTRGYFFLGDGHYVEMEQKLEAWNSSVTFGKQCMGLNSEFRALIESGEHDDGTAAIAFTEVDVPCVYWTATSLGKWAKAQGLSVTLANIPTVKEWIGRLDTLAPEYFYQATSRYWGAYYAAIPSFAGRDLERSRSEFDVAIEAFPEYFGSHVALAEYWATKAQDIAVFDEQISHVLSQCPNTVEGIEAEQEAEQRKATRLLAQRSELFVNSDSVAAPDIEEVDCSPAPVEEAPPAEEPPTDEGADNENATETEAADDSSAVEELLGGEAGETTESTDGE